MHLADRGSSSEMVKAGFAGDDAPRAVFRKSSMRKLREGQHV